MKPVLDQSRSVERYIVPDDNVRHLLCIHLVLCGDTVVKSVLKCENVGHVVGPKLMVVEDPILHDRSAQYDVTTTLALDIQNSSVANDVSPSSSYFCQVKPSLIYEDKFMWDCISIHLQNSGKKTTLCSSTYSCHGSFTLSEFLSNGTR